MSKNNIIKLLLLMFVFLAVRLRARFLRVESADRRWFCGHEQLASARPTIIANRSSEFASQLHLRN